MRSFSTHECLVYPGEYVPRQDMERRMAALRSGRNKMEPDQEVSLKELPASFHMEIPLPGVSREEIMLFVMDHVLTIDILQEGDERTGTSRPGETGPGGTEKQIPLPGNADMEFVSAEFRKGVLSLCIPKALGKGSSVTRQIIVY